MMKALVSMIVAIPSVLYVTWPAVHHELQQKISPLYFQTIFSTGKVSCLELGSANVPGSEHAGVAFALFGLAVIETVRRKLCLGTILD